MLIELDYILDMSSEEDFSLIFKAFRFFQSEFERFGYGIDDLIRRVRKSLAGIRECIIKTYQSDAISYGDEHGEDISSGDKIIHRTESYLIA